MADRSPYRRAPRPDRAAFHAELSDVAAMRGVWTLRDLIEEAGGPDGERQWSELLELLDTARATLPKCHTSISAALRVLSVLAALHRKGGRGYRGVIAPLDEWSKHVDRLTGHLGGCSPATVRNAHRILEAAGLVERTVHGRGKAEEYGKDADGEPLHARALVCCVTLTVVAVSFWGVQGGCRSVRAREMSSPLNLGGNTSGSEQFASLTRDARPSTSGRSVHKEPPNAVSAFADDVSRAAFAAASSREGGASAVPRRRYAWRPLPSEPNDHGNARRALLYDLETWLLKARRDDVGDVLGVVAAELDPGRRIAALAGAEVADRAATGSGVPWDDWIWRWRGLPLVDRRAVCQRAILPAVVGYLSRLDVVAAPPDRFWVPGEHTREPGPRARPPTSVGFPAPRRPAAPPPPRPEWLTRLESRYGGEEG